jgi:hypothetical protein
MFVSALPEGTASMLQRHKSSRTTLIPLIQFLSLVVVFALPVVWGASVYTSTQVSYAHVKVASGDTVWGLVARSAAPGSDIAESAYRVAQINHLNPKSKLQAGQILLIPR